MLRIVCFTTSFLAVVAACAPPIEQRPSTAVRVIPLTSAADCPNGGQQIDTGIDENGNGKLDDNEVDESVIVCNGTNGADGRDGEPCTVADGPGTDEKTVTCGNASVVIRDGDDGTAGDDCTVVDGPNTGEHTVTCGSTSVVVADGAPGAPGASCTVASGPNADENTVTCGSTSVVIVDGASGTPGAGCTIANGPNPGEHTVTCGATSVVVHDGAVGSPGIGCTVASGPNAGQRTVTCGSTSVAINDGAAGAGCSVADGPAPGQHTVACGSTSVIITDGATGSPGTNCSVFEGPNPGENTVTCGGNSIVIRNGVNGGTGPIGLSTLIRLEPELGGPRCPFSGTRVLTGVDDNSNQALEGAEPGDGEIDDEAILCTTTRGECAAGFAQGPDGTCQATPPSCFAMRFDGGTNPGDTVVAPLDAFTGRSEFTAEAWVNLSSYSQFGRILGDIGTTITILGDSGYGPRGVQNHIGIYTTRSCCFTVSEAFSGNVFPLNEWHHVAMQLRGGSLELWIDGVLESSTPGVGAIVDIPQLRAFSGFIFAVGDQPRISDNVGDEALSGMLDEVRLSSRAKYSNNFTPKDRIEADQDTVLLWSFDEGTGDVAVDKSGLNNDGTFIQTPTRVPLANCRH